MGPPPFELEMLQVAASTSNEQIAAPGPSVLPEDPRDAEQSYRGKQELATLPVRLVYTPGTVASRDLRPQSRQPEPPSVPSGRQMWAPTSVVNYPRQSQGSATPTCGSLTNGVVRRTSLPFHNRRVRHSVPTAASRGATSSTPCTLSNSDKFSLPRTLARSSIPSSAVFRHTSPPRRSARSVSPIRSSSPDVPRRCYSPPRSPAKPQTCVSVSRLPNSAAKGQVSLPVNPGVEDCKTPQTPRTMPLRVSASLDMQEMRRFCKEDSCLPAKSGPPKGDHGTSRPGPDQDQRDHSDQQEAAKGVSISAWGSSIATQGVSITMQALSSATQDPNSVTRFPIVRMIMYDSD